METILLYLLIGVFLTLIFFSNSNRKFQKLDNQSKLKLIEVNIYVRKIYLTSLLFIIAFFYLIVQLDLFNVYFPIIISVFLLSIILAIVTNRKSTRLGIPIQYSRKSLVSKIIISIIFCSFCIFQYTQTEQNEKTAYDFQMEAQEQMMKHNWENGVKLYSKSIELDSTNGNCFYNRGCCKYFSLDTLGACKDWKKASELGDETASYNLSIYCK